MIGKYAKGRVHVFIDAANLENSVKDLGWWVDYRRLYQYLNQEMQLVGVRHYCPRLEDQRQDKFFTVLKYIGIQLVTKPLKIIDDPATATGHHRKANFDVEMALDALELMDQYETLILFSGDSDFDTLVRRLCERGKLVIVVSTKHHVARELIASCNKYIDLRRLRGYIERIGKTKSPPFPAGS